MADVRNPGYEMQLTEIQDRLETIRKEVKELERWKQEAVEVLGDWDKVAEMVPLKPENLGKSKAVIVADEIHILRCKNEGLQSKLNAAQSVIDGA